MQLQLKKNVVEKVVLLFFSLWLADRIFITFSLAALQQKSSTFTNSSSACWGKKGKGKAGERRQSRGREKEGGT